MAEHPKLTEIRAVLSALYEAARPHGRLANWLAAKDLHELWRDAKAATTEGHTAHG